MRFKTIFILYLLTVFIFNLISVPLFATNIQSRSKLDVKCENLKIEDAFEGINGCAVIFDSENGKYYFYNKKMAKIRVSPCSTFKIVSALLGLKYGILKYEKSTMHYDSTLYPINSWNGNLSLKEAFKFSCVWYFRQVIDAVGNENVKKELKSLSYGNCDVSEWDGSAINPFPELNGFWLNSSLKISPLEQIKVLLRIFEKSSHYSGKEIKILKNIMLVKETKNSNIYGKTGSDGQGHAWFVGFKENTKDSKKEYFSVYLNDEYKKDLVSNQKAKEIAFKILDTQRNNI